MTKHIHKKNSIHKEHVTMLSLISVAIKMQSCVILKCLVLYDIRRPY